MKKFQEYFTVVLVLAEFFKDANYKELKPSIIRLSKTYKDLVGSKSLTPVLIDLLIDLIYAVKSVGGIQNAIVILQKHQKAHQYLTKVVKQEISEI